MVTTVGFAYPAIDNGYEASGMSRTKRGSMGMAAAALFNRWPYLLWVY